MYCSISYNLWNPLANMSRISICHLCQMGKFFFRLQTLQICNKLATETKIPQGIEPGSDVSLMFHLSYHWTTVFASAQWPFCCSSPKCEISLQGIGNCRRQHRDKTVHLLIKFPDFGILVLHLDCYSSTGYLCNSSTCTLSMFCSHFSQHQITCGEI